MPIGIHTINGIPIEYERSTRLHCTLDDQTQHILDGNGSLCQSVILQTLFIPPLPFITPIVFESISLDCQDFMRTEHVPRAVGVLFELLPKEIGDANSGENIMRLHAIISVIRAYLKKFGHITVPYIEVESHRSLPHPELIYCNGSIIGQFDPFEYTAGHSFESPDVASHSTHFT